MSEKEIAVVTGASGFVGSHLVDLLLEKGYHVRCLLRKTSSRKWLEGKPIEIIDSGLMDKAGLRTAFTGAAYIYHVAGVVKSVDAEGYFKGNVETTRSIMETAIEFKDSIKRIVVVSSLTATGPSPDGNPVTEETPCNPITTYGHSKLEGERVAQSYMDRLPITICRAPAVYGDRDTEILIFFKTYAGGLMTEIGFDNKVLSLIHAVDLVNGFYLAATSEKAKGEIYFVGSEEYYTWPQIGSLTGKILGKKAISLKLPHFVVYGVAAIAQVVASLQKKPATLNLEKAKDITRHAWTCSTQKLMRDTGYRQQLNIEQGIKRTIDWYKKEGWL